MSNRLKDFSAGERGRVTGFEAGSAVYRKKLLAMGLTPGIEVEVIRVAPLGDPIEIRVRGTAVSLRKGEADSLQVERQ